MATVTRPEIELIDPDFYVDLDRFHADLTWMRANEPLYRDVSGWVAVTRHADVTDVEHRSGDFTSAGSYRANWSPTESNMIAQDDPGHMTQRKLVSRRFTPKAVHNHEDDLRRMIDDMLDAGAAKGGMEVVDDLASQLPGRLTAILLGWPEDRWRDMKSWSERQMRIDSITRDQDALMGLISAIGEFQADLNVMVPERRECPRDDLLSVWANGEQQGCPYDDERIMHETGLFISGGAETTRTVIARGLRILADHPEAWEAMAADPALVPSAVEEIIRWVSPLNQMFRTATRDTEVAGVPIAAGTRMALMYPSANRDESVFADPFTFDIHRSPNPQIAFGFGTHFCLGASLARLELRMLFAEMTRRFTNLRVTSEPDIEANVFVGAVRSFGLAFDAR